MAAGRRDHRRRPRRRTGGRHLRRPAHAAVVPAQLLRYRRRALLRPRQRVRWRYPRRRPGGRGRPARAPARSVTRAAPFCSPPRCWRSPPSWDGPGRVPISAWPSPVRSASASSASICGGSAPRGAISVALGLAAAALGAIVVAVDLLGARPVIPPRVADRRDQGERLAGAERRDRAEALHELDAHAARRCGRASPPPPSPRWPWPPSCGPPEYSPRPRATAGSSPPPSPASVAPPPPSSSTTPASSPPPSPYATPPAPSPTSGWAIGSRKQLAGSGNREGAACRGARSLP